jgi:hypothetical protein
MRMRMRMEGTPRSRDPKTRRNPLGGDTPPLRLGACFSRRARTPAWGLPTCLAAWLRRLTVIQGDFAAVASGCVTSDGLLHPMACIEAAEGGCALRLADIVFSSVRNCAALSKIGWEDRGVVSGRKISTAVSTLGWTSEYGYHGATGNMREALCPERTGGFLPSSVGSLGCSGGWCSTSCVEAVARQSDGGAAAQTVSLGLLRGTKVGRGGCCILESVSPDSRSVPALPVPNM